MHIFTVGVLKKYKIWVHQGAHKPFLSQFCLFSEIFCLFLQFFTLESCYIWFTLSLEYPSAYVYSFALVKFKILTCLGVCKPCFEPYCPLSEFFQSCWVSNAVCFRTSTRAVGPFSLRLVMFCLCTKFEIEFLTILF